MITKAQHSVATTLKLTGMKKVTIQAHEVQREGAWPTSPLTKGASRLRLRQSHCWLGLSFFIYQTDGTDRRFQNSKSMKGLISNKKPAIPDTSWRPPSLPPLHHIEVFQLSSWLFLHMSKQCVFVTVSWFIHFTCYLADLNHNHPLILYLVLPLWIYHNVD